MMQARASRNRDYPPSHRVRRKLEFAAPDFSQQSQKINTNIISDGNTLVGPAVIPIIAETLYYESDDLIDSDCDSMDDMEELRASASNRARPPSSPTVQKRNADYAYWMQREIRTAIYGSVWQAQVLKRVPTTDGSLTWTTTPQFVAVKEMNWQQIMQEERTSAERPLQEIGAMCELRNVILANRDANVLGTRDQASMDTIIQAMMEHHVMTYIDILSDDKFLYLVMPYCDGGEMFDILDRRRETTGTTFSEDEARYLIKQILKGVDTLQRAGICHRDMSLENLLMTEDNEVALIIDFGMSIKIPYIEERGIMQRCLVERDRTCGKPYYVSPEILSGSSFDGFAVDMWAIGPILFMLVNGFPPWDIACERRDTSRCYRAFSRGQLRQSIQSWNLGMSDDLIDLLQGLFWRDPQHRLSLRDVLKHPWMDGPIQRPNFEE
jgi:serine/threonine protein kinase